ncbi:4'-phosphopantetheinyl transferase family protein [Taibaiella koreensis]|uniref:4'-phosphopantetheinyl transferase family protein n=1 Tax=Taibaiella koreensis TaxID=1268548 RepID=UPI000E59B25A|nr:4'-phosphopantetheinyl transferase superfamily protein [Taibaiella koreensis]
MIQLGYTENIHLLSEQAIFFLYSILAEEEKRRIEKLYRWHDRQASLLGKFLLYQLLGGQENDKEILSRLTYSQYGKPLLEGTGISFNISHSGDYVVCAVSEQQEIGLDIEKVENVQLDDFTGTLSEDEFSHIIKSPQKNLTFFKTWTKKEAILKARGSGIVSDMSGFKQIDEGVVTFRQESFFVTEIDIDPQYCCTLAGTRMHEPVRKIKLIPEEQIPGSFFS